MSLLVYLVIGGIAGWITGMILKGDGYGVLADIAIGVVGGVIGGWVFGAIGINGGGFFGALITAIIGAVGLSYGLRAFRRAYPS